MPTDKQNVEFLYSIIKQLEVKHINWPLIAETNTIPNGHAARMRFHRLRQAMEGTAPRPRMPKDPNESKGGKVPYKRKAKEDADAKLKKKLAELEESEDDEEPLSSLAGKRLRVKIEQDDGSGDEYIDDSENIKTEDHEDRDVKMDDVDVQQNPVNEEPVEEGARATSEPAIKEEEIAPEPAVDMREDMVKHSGVKLEPEY